MRMAVWGWEDQISHSICRINFEFGGECCERTGIKEKQPCF